jgi:hypothetical protein
MTTSNSKGQAIRARISNTLNDPATSYWLSDALSKAMDRDPVDALNDAEWLYDLMQERCTAIVKGEWK